MQVPANKTKVAARLAYWRERDIFLCWVIVVLG
jgi:hypothetical protein